jgi:predicted esterase
MASYNILCLHGAGMHTGHYKHPNKFVRKFMDFENQRIILQMKEVFGAGAQFYFPRGSQECGQEHWIYNAIGRDNHTPETLFQWYENPDENNEYELGGIHASIEAVKDFVKTEMDGRVHILLGFSQGGMMIEKICEYCPEIANTALGAIFINSGGAWHMQPSTFGEDFDINHARSRLRAKFSHIKSLHICSKHDGLFKNHISQIMFEVFEPSPGMLCVETEGVEKDPHLFTHFGPSLLVKLEQFYLLATTKRSF